jgi:putative transposase
VEPAHPELSIAEQCALLGLARSTYYYAPHPESPENLAVMRALDEQYLRTPYYGVRKMTAHLQAEGFAVNHKRVARLMGVMGLAALTPPRRTSKPGPDHRIYPYLLRNVTAERPNHVWSTDITYVGLPRGFVYLVAVLDWYSRYVLSWELSNALEGAFCLSALERALGRGRPEIFNTDQGSQFTSAAFTGCLEAAGVRVSMDGRGRCFDNIFVERLWRTVKYEEVYLKEYGDVAALAAGLGQYFVQYNEARLHQALGYRTPASVHFGERAGACA